MLDKAITVFLEEKEQSYYEFVAKKEIKLDKLKSNSNKSFNNWLLYISNGNTSLVHKDLIFENWLIYASKKAKELNICSHPPKFSHPSAKATSLIVDATKDNDGLLRSGNVDVSLDVFGNAAALDVEKFLRVKLSDARTILQHLEENTDVVKKQFHTKNTDFNEIRLGLMKIKQSDLEQTSEKLKQVYFPVDDDYHLLSILNASGIIYKLKQRINDLRFSEENKQLREEVKKAKPAEISGKITEIYDLTSVGYGGTKPQNISTINNQNGGVSTLLSSMPPIFEKRQTQPPKSNFFDDCLWINLFKSDFAQFHAVLSWRKNNIEIRDMRDDIVLNSITKLKRLVENIRDISRGWSDTKTYQALPKWQKIWLDDQYSEIRHEESLNENYLDQAQNYFAHWFIGNYKLSTKDSKLLGNDDIEQIKKILKEEQELLR